MKSRCCDPRNTLYYRYGGRGIAVCEGWQRSFVEFLADVGLKPSPKHMLERRDNDGNYEPSNCCWATRKVQSRNRSDNLYILYRGRRMALLDAIDTYGAKAPYGCILGRLRRGWDATRALETPTDTRRHRSWKEFRDWKRQHRIE